MSEKIEQKKSIIEQKSKPHFLRVKEDKIIFTTTLNSNGVAIITDELINLVHSLTTKIGCKVKYTEGNYEETAFVIDREITEEEAEKMELDLK